MKSRSEHSENGRHRFSFWLLADLGLLVLILAAWMVYQGLHKTPASSGMVHFLVEVITPQKQETFEMESGQATLGSALQEMGFIDGQESSYGLFVTCVNGIESHFEQDGSWWKLQVDGQDASVGVDQIELAEGQCYTWILEQ